jgi:flagellar basal-body rod modification protein FlgD
MDKNDFLRILVTQLQFQDPLAPQDPAEFTSQLTQMGSLEQLMNVNESIESLQMLQLSSNNTQAVNLIGKDILYYGDTVESTTGQPTDLQYTLPADAASVTVRVRDESGNLVKTIQLGKTDAGLQKAVWDGTDSNGNVLSGGTFQFEVTAVDATGNTLTAETLTTGRVSGIVFEDGVTILKVGDRRVRIGEVVGVNQGQSSAATTAESGSLAYPASYYQSMFNLKR